MKHDELLARIDWTEKGLMTKYRIGLALRAVVELTNNLQDTESWQDNAEYNAGYNNAMYEIIQAIKKELK